MDKKLFLGIAIGLILITGGCLVWQLWYTPMTSDNENETLVPCSDIQGQLLKDDCYWREASQKRDSSICDKIQNQETIDNCYYSYIASSNQDVSICNSMQDQTRKDECYWLIAVSKKDQSICNNIGGEEKKGTCEMFATDPNEEDFERMNLGLSLNTLNMLNWKTYTNDVYNIKYPDNVLIVEGDKKTEFSSKERGEHSDAGAGLRRDISRDYMVIAADQEECDWQKEGFGIEKCEFGTTTPIMYFKIETISKPIEEVVDEVTFGYRGDLILIDSAKYGLDGKAYYERPQGFEGTGYETHFFEYAPELTILITHFSDMGVNNPIEREFTFSSQNILFDKIMPTLKFIK
jgi:hypothetical protein